jgi:hypothetical protein
MSVPANGLPAQERVGFRHIVLEGGASAIKLRHRLTSIIASVGSSAAVLRAFADTILHCTSCDHYAAGRSRLGMCAVPDSGVRIAARTGAASPTIRRLRIVDILLVETEPSDILTREVFLRTPSGVNAAIAYRTRRSAPLNASQSISGVELTTTIGSVSASRSLSFVTVQSGRRVAGRGISPAGRAARPWLADGGWEDHEDDHLQRAGTIGENCRASVFSLNR